MRNIRLGALALAFFAISGSAFAQESGGRTDGPEGSEIGKGGYTRLGGDHKVSLTLDWGGVFLSDGGTGNTPFMLGGTLSWAADDWVSFDFSGEYLFDLKGFEPLVGPRFRAPFYPVAFNVGVKAGALVYTPSGGLDSKAYFVLSPQAGLELTMIERIAFGLNYALDIPIGADELINRIYLSVGYKF
jgi:hypothetical protein